MFGHGFRALVWAVSPLLVVALSMTSGAEPPRVAPARADANRFRYLDELNPYYPHRDFPKLTAPMWVGEQGVEAVVILAIDDMRGHERWEDYLRPILDRLKQIDGRAAASIMTCQIDPAEPHLQKWLQEGVSLECHTYDHPCPLLGGGDFAKAKGTYDRCVDLLATVPGSKPVAFRTPCCDSLNTLSPRFFAEIMQAQTPGQNRLHVDSSVFNVLTADDPELPRELVLESDGTERFKKYLPRDRGFVNTIENYPYPYLIGESCWEFPCVTPSDWSAQHFHKPANPKTVEDWKAALDAVVIKQGVFCLVFHPYEWIRSDQVVELVDYADTKYGRRVKFLNFREAHERLVKNLRGRPAIDAPGAGRMLLLDANNDGYLDVGTTVDRAPLGKLPYVGPDLMRLWSPVGKRFVESPLPATFSWSGTTKNGPVGGAPRFACLGEDRMIAFHSDGRQYKTYRWNWTHWDESDEFIGGLPRWEDEAAIRFEDKQHTLVFGADVRFHDLDGDGTSELVVFASDLPTVKPSVYAFQPSKKQWQKLPWSLPLLLPEATFRHDARLIPATAGLKLVDVDEDGHDDWLYSDERRVALYLWKEMESGWSTKVFDYKRGQDTIPPEHALPPFVRGGTHNGVFIHSRSVVLQNEDTSQLPDLVFRRSFNDLLGSLEVGPRSPSASLRATKPRGGFSVDVVAAEPLTMDPVAIEWGPDGRLWVAEMADYPMGIDGQGQPGGRVRYLEDTDGDGTYDRSTLFLEDVPYPTGVMQWRKGVLVSSAPDLFYAEDTDGDGRADLREPLFVGFAPGNQQHRVNGFAWGLDNWLHLANGDSGGLVRSVKTGEALNIRGRDLRIRPDTGEMELQTGQTQFGRSRDDWGNWFGNNNSFPMFHFALDEHYLGRNPHYAPPDPRVQVSETPGASPVFPLSRTLARFNDLDRANRFTSACSTIVYRDDLFGPAFAGSVFIAEPVHNLVSRQVMSPLGATFTSRRAGDERQSEFLASSDGWFRPTTVKVGPDGALYVVDMYRHVIEHPEWIPDDWEARLDLRAGHDKGRIFRVAPIGAERRTTPRLDRLNLEQLVAALDSPSGWQRDTAQRLLVERGDAAAREPLERLFRESKNPLARLHALATLDGLALGAPDAGKPRLLDDAILLAGLADSHSGIVRHAVRLCDRRLEAPDAGPFGDRLLALTQNAAEVDPQLAIQLAYTLGQWPDARAGEGLARLLLSRDDLFLTAAVFSSLSRTNLPPIVEAVATAAGSESADTQELATRAQQLVSPILAQAVAHDPENGLAFSLERLSRAGGEQASSWRFAAVVGLLEAQQRAQRPWPEEAIAPILDAAAAVVSDGSMADIERVAAVRVLGFLPDRRERELDLLASLLTLQSSYDVQLAAAARLSAIDDERTSGLLLAGWSGHGPALRKSILAAHVAREKWAIALLRAVESQSVPAQEIDASVRQELTQHPSEHVSALAAKVLHETATDPNRRAVIERYLADVRETSPDKPRGAEVFRKSCSPCHKLGEVGHAVGPDLASLRNRSDEYLLTAILDPNRAVEARYQNFVAVTDDGRTLTGLVKSETASGVILATADGKEHTLLRSQLESFSGTGKSLMPEGIEKDFSPQAAADLLAWLGDHAPPRKIFPGNEPRLVEPEGDGRIVLTADAAEIFGPNLVFESQYQNLGYWASADDHAGWTVKIPQAGRYRVRLVYACPTEDAGNKARCVVDDRPVVATILGTGSWDDYRDITLGEVELTSGQRRVTFQSDGPVRGHLLDLKEIRLLPVR